jgi:hypothetical protein
MRSSARCFVFLFVLFVSSALHGRNAVPTEEAPPTPDIASPLRSPAPSGQPGLPDLGFLFRTDCVTQRTLCYSACPPSGPDKVPCFLACQCQYLQCMGGSCTE